MMENQNISQILAIMVTDIVGYTQTMNEDDNKAWDYIKKQRAIIPPMVSKMNGYMFKEMGDGTYSKFKSAIDAVQCAVRINNEAIKRELPIKIGVHLGEVKDDGHDVIGTGVNIADRINSLATANKIIISDDIWRQIRSQADMEATSMGKKELKGYHESLEVFELIHNPDGSLTKKIKVTETVTYTDEEGKKVQAESAKKEFIKKVAIFPFDYNGDDTSIDYLTYGFPFGCCISLLQDPLVEIQFPNQNELSGYSFFSRLNDFSRKHNTHVPNPLKKKIAKEIHSDYFVSGTLNFIPDNFEVIIKLYNSNNGKLISENSFQGSDYFTLIDECSLYLRKAMDILDSHIQEIENSPFCEIVTESIDTYKNYIDGMITREYKNDYKKACELFKRAVKNDPTCSLANYSLFWSGFLSADEGLKKDGSAAMNSSIAHIYKLPDRVAYIIKVYNYFFEKGSLDQAKKVVQMWMKQYPDTIEPYRELSNLYFRNLEHDKAIAVNHKILENHPTYYLAYSWINYLYIHNKDADNALIYAEKYLKCYPSEAHAYAIVARSYKLKGDYSKAKEFYEQALVLEMNSIHYMVELAEQEVNLGNFIEAEEQVEEALLNCKTDQDFYMVYDGFNEIYQIQGKIKESLKYDEKKFDCEKKFQNPLDASLHRMMNSEQYCLINKTETAMKIIDDEVKKTIPPFNLLGKGIGLLLLSAHSEDKKNIKSGLETLDEFNTQLPIHGAVVGKFQTYANGLICMIDKDYDKAIELFKTIESFFQATDYLLRFILRCHNKNQDFKTGIKKGEDYLKKHPYAPAIMLEVAKSYIGLSDLDMANKQLTELLSIWSDADEEYILFQEAKKLWKEINKK